MKLRITVPDQQPFEVEVEGDQATLGRSVDCDVVVASPYVSKTHVRFMRGLVAFDLGSSNGTFNDQGDKLEGAGLVHDGRIWIGTENVLVEVLDEEPGESDETEAHELMGLNAGLEHQLEELRNENAYLRLQVESMRKTEATRSAVQALTKAQLEKEGKDLTEFERMQRSYMEVLERLQSDIETRLREREAPF